MASSRGREDALERRILAGPAAPLPGPHSERAAAAERGLLRWSPATSRSGAGRRGPKRPAGPSGRQDWACSDFGLSGRSSQRRRVPRADPGHLLLCRLGARHSGLPVSQRPDGTWIAKSKKKEGKMQKIGMKKTYQRLLRIVKERTKLRLNVKNVMRELSYSSSLASTCLWLSLSAKWFTVEFQTAWGVLGKRRGTDPK